MPIQLMQFAAMIGPLGLGAVVLLIRFMEVMFLEPRLAGFGEPKVPWMSVLEKGLTTSEE
jgi:hypothetical protein